MLDRRIFICYTCSVMQDMHFLRLWDIYSPLLTENQREITNLYFNYDLSLAEIAEQKGCSRQSVSDCLQKSRKQLEEYEEKLRFCRKLSEISDWAEEVQHRREGLKDEISRLEEILSRDYTQDGQ